jgi:hypothetical protein
MKGDGSAKELGLVKTSREIKVACHCITLASKMHVADRIYGNVNPHDYNRSKRKSKEIEIICCLLSPAACSKCANQNKPLTTVVFAI